MFQSSLSYELTLSAILEGCNTRNQLLLIYKTVRAALLISRVSNIIKERKVKVGLEGRRAIVYTWQERILRSRTLQWRGCCQRVRKTALAKGGGRKRKKSCAAILQEKREKALKMHVISTIERMRKVKIAHAMDPVQRAGQTEEANIREASRFGRTALSKKKKGSRVKSFLKLILNLLFMLLFPVVFQGNTVVKLILKGLEHQHKKRKKQKSKSATCHYSQPVFAL